MADRVEYHAINVFSCMGLDERSFQPEARYHSETIFQ